MEDRISGGLQHRHEMCCEKGGHRGRQACMVRKWFHRGDVVSRQVDLYMTELFFCPTLRTLDHNNISNLLHRVLWDIDVMT